MQVLSVVFILAVTLLLAWCGYRPHAGNPHPRVTQFITAPGVDAVENAARVRSLRLIDTDPDRRGPQKTIEGPALTPSQRALLRAAILDDSHYVWEAAKRCIFHPDAAFVFEDAGGRELLKVTVCFSCDEWRFSTGGMEDMDPVAPDLRRLVDTLFPNHPLPPRP